MENCSRPNSGTVNHIQLKLLTGIDHQSGITWHDSKVKRWKVKVTLAIMYKDEMCHNSVSGDPIDFILGGW